MTTTLTDRHVAATLDRLARKHRRQIDQELRAAIAEAIEAHIEQGQSPAEAEYAALKELGDPARFATRYADRSAVLIGPNVYRSYVIALRLPCAIVIPVVFIMNDIGYWTRGDSVGTGIFGPIGITLTAAMYLLVAVTVAFLLVDRSAVDGSDGRNAPSGPRANWSTPNRRRPGSLASSAASSVGAVHHRDRRDPGRRTGSRRTAVRPLGWGCLALLALFHARRRHGIVETFPPPPRFAARCHARVRRYRGRAPSLVALPTLVRLRSRDS